MKTVETRVIVDKPLKIVFSLIADFENWQKLSPNFSNTKVLMQEPGRHITVMNSSHGVLNPPLVTVREFTAGRSINFTHIVPSFPIREHYGKWRFLPESGNRTKIVLTHKFKCRFSIFGKLLESLVVSPFFIQPHTKEMLKQMKNSIEAL